VAEAKAMFEGMVAANPGAMPEMREYTPEELQAIASGAKDEQQAMKNLHKDGVDAPAVMHAMRPTGVTGFSGAMEFEFDVTIELASGASHWTKIVQQMLPAQVHGLADGGALTVKYDPDNAKPRQLVSGHGRLRSRRGHARLAHALSAYSRFSAK
jgi:hypothetical protein